MLINIKKILICFVLLCNYANALNLKDLDFDIYLISKDDNIQSKIIEYKVRAKILQNYQLKIITKKEKIKDKTFYLKIYSDINTITKSNVKYLTEINSIIIKINKYSPKEIDIFFHNPDRKKVNIIFDPIHSFEFETFYEHRNMIAGIAYGIIFCAFLYSLIMYLNTHFRSLLYYSFIQLLTFITLLQDYYFRDKSFSFANEDIITDYFTTLIVILIILFSKEVLSFKKYQKFFKNFCLVIIVLNLIDFILIYFYKQTVLYEIIPLYALVLLLIILGLISAFQGFKFSFFYVAGWGILFISLLINEYNLFYLSNIAVLIIGLPLESFILSIALGYKFKGIIAKKKEKEQLFIQQSKLASMGNMINNIAHQWRQTLSNLSFINMDLKMAIQTDDINMQYLKTVTQNSSKQIDFMSKTLDNFKNFYQPKRDKETFFISSAIYNAINIIEPTFKDNDITLEFIIKEDKEITSYENEYSQIVLNILSNANDALLLNKEKNQYVKILLFVNKSNKSVLRISDNGKGINENILEKIFDPYFSTKKNNSGIGLYMSNIIAKSHLKAEIKAYNSSFGACFEIIL